MGILEEPPGGRRDNCPDRVQLRDAQTLCHARRSGCIQVHLRNLLQLALVHLPQLDRLVVCSQQELSIALRQQPLDLVDLLIDFKRPVGKG
jgi:hypothetical protein